MRKNIQIIALLTIAAVVYCSISIVNHYNFRTYTLDLGLYTNAIYQYSKFKIATMAILNQPDRYILSDHFDLYLLILSPLRFVFGTYTLLVVQILAIIIGGLGVYKVVLFKTLSYTIARKAIIIFFFSFSLFSALSFDYHSNVVSLMIVPWIYYFLVYRRKYFMATTFMFLFIIGKETNAIFLLLFCLLYLVYEIKDKGLRLFLALMCIFCVLYFVVITAVVMPFFMSGENYEQVSKFPFLQTPTNDIIVFAQIFVDNVVTNFTKVDTNDYIKLETILFYLFSGCFLILFHLRFLIIFIPIVLIKFLHFDPMVWSVHGHYSVEILIINTLLLFKIIEVRSPILYKPILTFLLFANIVLTIRIMDSTMAWTDRSRLRLYQSKHFMSELNRNALEKATFLIPKNASLCVQDALLPHYCLRDYVYLFPSIYDAEYILLCEQVSKYPLNEDTFRDSISQIRELGKYATVFEQDGVILFRRSVNKTKIFMAISKS
jgi:uncharacterized membrane protein